jgi:hypothetical protein
LLTLQDTKETIVPYNSFEFDVFDSDNHPLTVTSAFGAGYSNGKVFVIWNPDGEGNQDNGHCNLKQAVCDLQAIDVENKGAEQRSSWVTTPLEIQYARTDSTMALVSVENNMFLFWKQVNTNGVQNVLAGAVWNGTSWSSQMITMQCADGQPLWPRNSEDHIGVSATALNDEYILVACASASKGGTSFDDSKGGVYIGYYRIADMKNGLWAPVWDWLYPRWEFTDDGVLGDAITVSIDWYSALVGTTPQRILGWLYLTRSGLAEPSSSSTWTT